jgi:predicted nucleic acid-binding protein
MASTDHGLVLDSWAVLSYLGDEPAAAQIADLIASAHEADTPIYMSVVNIGEVWYIIAREVSAGDADACIKTLRDLRIQFVDADWELAHSAAQFKAHYKMSFADCFAAALTLQKEAVLVTGDREFEPLEKKITIQWCG